MGNLLTRLQVKNFRSLADVSVDVRPINVLFGPNGSGKSTLLEAIRLVKDCACRDVEEALRTRKNGFGMLYEEVQDISITLEIVRARYELRLESLFGQIRPYAGEALSSRSQEISWINRKTGSKEAYFYDSERDSSVRSPLPFPEKLALMQYWEKKRGIRRAVSHLRNLLNSAHFFHTRYVNLYGLKNRGSESGMDLSLREDCGNLWSVLRNIRDKSAIDSRYETILDFMQKSFPNFKDLVFELTGPNVVYASFVEKGSQDPIPALGVSEGQLQMLVHLTALFSQEDEHDSLIIFDEPETSLHPYAISVFAEAVKHATEEWNRQVFIATHSPVLIGQFEPEDILATGLDESGQTVLTRVSEMENIKDLLDNYDTGSLYMAEVIAPQSGPYTHGKAE